MSASLTLSLFHQSQSLIIACSLFLSIHLVVSTSSSSQPEGDDNVFSRLACVCRRRRRPVQTCRRPRPFHCYPFFLYTFLLLYIFFFNNLPLASRVSLFLLQSRGIFPLFLLHLPEIIQLPPPLHILTVIIMPIYFSAAIALVGGEVKEK